MNARREALARKRDNNGLNVGTVLELAYSPTYQTVGCRWTEPATGWVSGRFQVFNLNYPLHGRCECIDDWVSVGPCTERKGKVRP